MIGMDGELADTGRFGSMANTRRDAAKSRLPRLNVKYLEQIGI